MKKNKKFVILLLPLLMLLAGCNNKVYIEINGDSIITHTYGTEYKDAGYNVKDKKVIITVDNNIDVNRLGEQQVTYIALKKDKEVERKVRIVKVIDDKAPEIESLNEIEIFLNTDINDDKLKEETNLVVKDNYSEMQDIRVELSHEIDVKKEGEYKLIIKAIDTNNNEALKEIKVKVLKIHITSIAFDKTSLKMNKGGNTTLKVTYVPSNTDEDKELIWTSNNESVAKVDNGKITAINYGKSEICASLNVNANIKQCIEVNVEEVHITGINLDKTTVNLDVGKTSTLKATIVPSNASDDKTIVWSSSDEDVATVYNGKITAKSVGSSQVCATLKINASIKKCATIKVSESDLEKFKKYLVSIGFAKSNSNIYTITASAGLQTIDFVKKTFTVDDGEGPLVYNYANDEGIGTYYYSNGAVKQVNYNFKNGNTTCYIEPASYYSLCNSQTANNAMVNLLGSLKNLFITYVETAGVDQKNL